jgi:hypothetical protein
MQASAARLERGEVLRSAYATAGRNLSAMPGSAAPWIVYDDSAGQRTAEPCATAQAAAWSWDAITRAGMAADRDTPALQS